MRFSRYVAVGDSFTEGVGDELPDGSVRGWADLVALGLALSSPEPVSYANLAIRGRLLSPIAGTQMDAAIAMKPDLISINGGGNDIMRPRVSIARIADELLESVDRAVASGAHVLLASGANSRACGIGHETNFTSARSVTAGSPRTCSPLSRSRCLTSGPNPRSRRAPEPLPTGVSTCCRGSGAGSRVDHPATIASQRSPN